ncbi:MAG TPA: hypothetical protein VM050_04480 [Patescibacteria group bacterium]|nr:hypothetical protein [Patescibacteria group bacterium]
MFDAVTLMTIGLYLVSAVIFIWFGRFTLDLIKQHRNIYPILFELEEAEKRKQR